MTLTVRKATEVEGKNEDGERIFDYVCEEGGTCWFEKHLGMRQMSAGQAVRRPYES